METSTDIYTCLEQKLEEMVTLSTPVRLSDAVCADDHRCTVCREQQEGGEEGRINVPTTLGNVDWSGLG